MRNRFQRLSRFQLLSTIVLALAAAPAAVAADRAAPDPLAAGLTAGARLSALVERVKFEQKRLASLEAEFVQEKSSEFLAAPELSHGSFSYLRPERVRWEYREPKPITLVLDGDEMLTWYRDLGRAERVKVGRVSTQVFHYLNASGSLDSLLGYFSVTFAVPPPGEPWKLELAPRYARVAKRLSSMTLWVDPTLYLPTRVRYVEPNGDSTEYRLERLAPNAVIPESRFVVELPVGVEVRSVDLERRRGPGSKP